MRAAACVCVGECLLRNPAYACVRACVRTVHGSAGDLKKMNNKMKKKKKIIF